MISVVAATSLKLHGVEHMRLMGSGFLFNIFSRNNRKEFAYCCCVSTWRAETQDWTGGTCGSLIVRHTIL